MQSKTTNETVRLPSHLVQGARCIRLQSGAIMELLMTAERAWQELLETVEKRVPKQTGSGQPRLQWSRSNRLILTGQSPVQAPFVAEPGRYSIYFERFGADIGNSNFELPPGTGSLKTTVVTMLLEISNGEVFWRFPDGQTLRSAEVARRIIARLREFQIEYAMSVIAPGY